MVKQPVVEKVMTEKETETHRKSEAKRGPKRDLGRPPVGERAYLIMSQKLRNYTEINAAAERIQEPTGRKRRKRGLSDLSWGGAQ